ncbi:hypothetical protein GPJ56_004137 [Histomonas meleagridis]|uniref:uncharacterized protein n=1 Tax=Histomonas meleagridis TaxID=135588 RepID=UPI0035596483|nr:hypothetical protein GPJ56_004137 [Histomonas meleagridis]KAH0801478.1 hypothetical protein GO595_005730 [Histomonas meleagridis]
MLSGKAAKGETEKALENPNLQLDDLLKCNNLTTQLRNNNPQLMSFLMKPENIKLLYSYFTTKTQRSDQRLLLNLFQTSNVSLHRVFCDSIPLTESILSSLESNTPAASYGIGSILRILMRAIDLWPEDVASVFRYSATAYRYLVKNICKICVFQSCSDLLPAHAATIHPNVIHFIWVLFLSLAGESFVQKHVTHNIETFYLEDIPTYYEFSSFKDEEGDNFERNNHYRILHSIHLLRLFFAVGHVRIGGFQEYVCEYVSELSVEQFIPEIFDMMHEICPHELTKQRSMEIILKHSNDTTPASLRLIDSACSYLTICDNMISVDEVMQLVVCVGVSPILTQFSRNMILNIVKKMKFENEIKEKLKTIITYTWNMSMDRDCGLMKGVSLDMAKELELEWSTFEEFDKILKFWAIDDFCENEEAPKMEFKFENVQIEENIKKELDEKWNLLDEQKQIH